MDEIKFKTAPIDAGKSAEQVFGERMKRLQDALQLKQPDRVPVMLAIGYMLAELGGITRQELQDNFELSQEIIEKAALEFQPDTTYGLFGFGPGPSIALGDQMTKWPGHGLDENGSFQFAEQEFMKAEDYDAFLRDPSDWSLRTYLPRAFKNLGSLAKLPPFGMFSFGYYHTLNLASYASPELKESLKAFDNAIKAALAGVENMTESGKRLAALGFAPTYFMGGALIEAPFDYMSDTLRGMRGIMLDIHQRPEKLLAAQEKVLKFQVEFAINQTKAIGAPYVFIPLHRGSDGFMSIPQFEKFYWPTLKQTILELVENDITVLCFYEGVWNDRLKYLTELPKGKTVGWFQSSDIFKVKEVVGDTMCIIGGMPNSMLQGGTTEQVREYTKRLCKEVGKGGGYIMSTGIGELEGCQPELVKAWMDATREFGVY